MLHAEDDEEIKTVEILHNEGEVQIINVNDKKFDDQIIMTEGEENTLVVRVTNLNGLTKVRAVKFKNM